MILMPSLVIDYHILVETILRNEMNVYTYTHSSSQRLKAGKVLHIAKSGRLILRAERDVKAGQLLVDKDNRRVARSVELFGPVATPFLSAAPLTDRVKRYVGSELFLQGDRRFEGQKEDRRRRNR